MNWISLLVSLGALLISVAGYLRSGSALRRERVIRLEQRRQDAALAALAGEIGLGRCSEALRMLKSNDPELTDRINDTQVRAKALIAKMQTIRTALERLKSDPPWTLQSEVEMESIIGQLTQLQHQITDLERVAKS